MEENLRKSIKIIGNNNYDLFNLAVSLFYQRKYDESLECFLELETTFRISSKIELEIKRSILLCYLMLNNFEKVSDIIKLIEIDNEDEEIGVLEIADFYLAIGDYRNAIRNYEKVENYYFSIDWISEFLYCYFMLGKYEDFNILFETIVKEKENDILENKNDEEFNVEYEKDLKQEILDLEIAKEKILNNRFKITKKFDIYIKTPCYFFGCVQHSNSYNI